MSIVQTALHHTVGLPQRSVFRCTLDAALKQGLGSFQISRTHFHDTPRLPGLRVRLVVQDSAFKELPRTLLATESAFTQACTKQQLRRVTAAIDTIHKDVQCVCGAVAVEFKHA